ncbi:MAG: hypothetical protein QFB87_00990 [Patescibacteria group bacterium]|nr:hypothetical protein [Patescibacteria group bacterium]
MDFNRSTQQPGVTPSAHPAVAGAGRKGQTEGNKWGKIGLVSLVVGAAVILLALAAVAAAGGKDNAEQKFVDKGRLQAVFLSTGQVYFGNIKDLNSKYFVVSNIYYLQTSSTGQAANANTSVSLVKLGCELHSPFDQMVINRSQVTFWENLQDSGQVAKAVKTFKQQNPSGQKCSDSATNASTTNNVQGSSNTTTNSAPATTTPKQ